MIWRSLRPYASVAIVWLAVTGCAYSQGEDGNNRIKGAASGWRTNTEKRSIELSELMSGGPAKDGIPAIDDPRFATVADAQKWLKPNEPVISLKIENEARAYPLQILIWHEIVNDRVGKNPVLVTFCPLCYTAIVFDRRLDGKEHSFGVSGMLRHSDMVMYDRETESWWQQITGEAIVGDLTGKTLKQFPTQIISFEQFADAHPTGKVLSRETGHVRDYGRNPYVGYDDIDDVPFLFKGATDKRLRPMEKVVVVDLGSKAKAYPHSITKERRVVYDRIGSTEIVIFHSDGASSALDQARISESKNVGSTGVFEPMVGGQKLTFSYDKGQFVDQQTGSRWNILGKAISGKLKGSELKQLRHGDYFAFAWLVFKPETEIFFEPK
ncbi:MAG: DUF3179 domain-containing protein [Pyrinomonadaceae bacterium]